MKRVKKFFLGLLIVFGVILLFAAGLFTYLTITEYRPEPEEVVELYYLGDPEPTSRAKEPHWMVGYSAEELPAADPSTFTVLSWNVGYCALGEESDFFMDGGEEVRPEEEQTILKNFEGVRDLLESTDVDFILLQEVDSDSKRSYYKDEVTELRDALGMASAYAMNFSTNYVPYPWPPIGKVRSGLLTLSDHAISEATRISLPCPFSWPLSAANLKRCLLVTRVPVAGSDKELVLVNLHLEAYDDGEGKLEQSRQLREFVEQEYAAGNYVIAGGDWNQIFPEAESAYPNTHMDLWTPGYLDPAELGEGWSYVWDVTTPTCRLLNQPYDPADAANTQYYVIDGFLVSPNVKVQSVQTLDEGFTYSDHNPVLLTVSLGE